MPQNVLPSPLPLGIHIGNSEFQQPGKLQQACASRPGQPGPVSPQLAPGLSRELHALLSAAPCRAVRAPSTRDTIYLTPFVSCGRDGRCPQTSCAARRCRCCWSGSAGLPTRTTATTGCSAASAASGGESAVPADDRRWVQCRKRRWGVQLWAPFTRCRRWG